ncbi:CXXC motif containing zinc binding protein isoform X1 [Capsicum annuum]|uniref:CXXC motif containing zinc binding protein isoform X1 n=1 Tax=Capsicum annuum TaxID=4072 RepID=UPI001FB0E009|nr:CXXC motif containing zinc binding protein isoform X1 [Capsicum annuum]
MVNFLLSIMADLENLTDLQPLGGCSDDNFRYHFKPQGGCTEDNFCYHFKLKCGKCGEITQKETYVSLVETVPLPIGKGNTHLIQKCKFCCRDGTVTMITGRGRPLTHEDSEAKKSAPLMLFECRGYEPLDFVFRGEWQAVSLDGTKFTGIDLSGGEEYVDYDEKGGYPVMISNPRAAFHVVK